MLLLRSSEKMARNGDKITLSVKWARNVLNNSELGGMKKCNCKKNNGLSSLRRVSKKFSST